MVIETLALDALGGTRTMLGALLGVFCFGLVASTAAVVALALLRGLLRSRALAVGALLLAAVLWGLVRPLPEAVLSFAT